MADLDTSKVPNKLGTIPAPLTPVGEPHTISVCMIVKNEAEKIAQALDSFLPVADEIIVNDTGSTDQTLEILRRYPTVKVVQNPWQNDFSLARNQAMEHATCAWILVMDADDVIPAEQVAGFAKLKYEPLDRAFGIEVINTQAGLPIGASLSRILMFPNHPALRFERKIHEQIIFAIANLGLHLVHTAVKIWHTGYESEELRRHKAERNLQLLLQEPDLGRDPVLSTQLGDAYSILERHLDAIRAYQKVFAIPHSRELNFESWLAAILSIGKSFLRLERYSDAQDWYQQAVQEAPDSHEAVFHLGESLYKKGEYTQAKVYLQKSLTMHNASGTQAQNQQILRMYAWDFLCNIHYKAQDYTEALAFAQKFKSEFPMVIETSFWLGKIHFALQQYPKAIFHLEQGLSKDDKISREAWLVLLSAYEVTGNELKMQQTQQKIKAIFSPESLPPAKCLLSVCMIVKNEEKYLGQCLESAAGLWDELIVVDTGSTDQTVSVAESFGAQVHHFPWVNDFSAARNASLDLATGKWILWLDADDIILPTDKKAMRQLVENSRPEQAYSFLIKNSQNHGVSGTVFNQIRLVPNHPQIRFEGRVHEQLMPALQRLKIPVQFLSITVVHTGYTDVETIRAKQERNLALLQDDLRLDPQQVNAMKYFSVGNAYLDLGDYQQAAQWYQKCMDRAEKVGEDQHLLKMAPVKIAECKAALGNLPEAHDILERYLQNHPSEPMALAAFAKAKQSMGADEQAAKIYGSLLCFQEAPTLTPIDYHQIKVTACKFLANYWHEKGAVQLAVPILKMGIAAGKGDLVHCGTLSALYFEEGQYEYAEPILEMAQRLEASGVNSLALAKVYIMTNKIQAALDLLDQAVKNYPHEKEISTLYTELKADLGLE